jgi:triosephosphate isomerase
VTVYIGTSWKMNKTLDEARAFAMALNEVSVWPESVQPFVLPPHTVLSTVRTTLDPRTGVWVGAQNAHWVPSGPFTGEVSMTMVKDAGASIVEIGHSERREQFNETDRSVNLKVIAALAAGLVPLLCVGERLETRSRGETLGFVLKQVDAAFANISDNDARKILIAYEPVWAIGDSGIPARPEDVAEVISAISTSRDVRGVLYGGSVNHANAAELLSVPAVDGLFVGRSAWTADGFLSLVSIAAEARGTRPAPSTSRHAPHGDDRKVRQ